MKKQGKRYKAIKNQIPEEKQEISNALKICKETLYIQKSFLQEVRTRYDFYFDQAVKY